MYPYVKRFWSHRAFNDCFSMYDGCVGRWEVDDQDRSVVKGGTNEKMRRFKERNERNRGIRAQESETATGPSLKGHELQLAGE